ncbi:MAG: hypothetical protein LBU98_03920 [Alistipes sp.]|jgi:hypothetical protein|nr:hypothetical protein [Alistipes sp.]
MLINFESPVQPVDACARQAFVEILNLILLSKDVAQLDRLLRKHDIGKEYRRLSGWFKWSYADYSFTLWQRMEFGSEACFRNKVLEVKHVALLCEDRYRHPAVIN